MTPPLPWSMASSSHVWLDCLWLIAEAYREFTHCDGVEWQHYWTTLCIQHTPEVLDQ